MSLSLLSLYLLFTESDASVEIESSESAGYEEPAPKRAREVRSSSRTANKPTPGATSSVGTRKKSVAHKKKGKEAASDEEEPTLNMGEMDLELWKDVRKKDPYRFPERTYKGKDRRFWTKAQAAMWTDFYDDKDHMRVGFFVKSQRLNQPWLNMYLATDFRYVDEALRKMDLMDLACLEQKYYPDVVRQFFCTVFFHSDPERTMSWMTGDTQFSGTYA